MSKSRVRTYEHLQNERETQRFLTQFGMAHSLPRLGLDCVTTSERFKQDGYDSETH